LHFHYFHFSADSLISSVPLIFTFLGDAMLPTRAVACFFLHAALSLLMPLAYFLLFSTCHAAIDIFVIS